MQVVSAVCPARVILQQTGCPAQEHKSPSVLVENWNILWEGSGGLEGERRQPAGEWERLAATQIDSRVRRDSTPRFSGIKPRHSDGPQGQASGCMEGRMAIGLGSVWEVRLSE